MEPGNVLERLGVLEEKIKDLKSQYKDLISRGAAVAREMGILLAEARTLVRPAHKWSKYCVSHLDMVPGTAHRYITIAKNWERIEKSAAFPNLSVDQMFDVARGRKPRKRKFGIRDQTLDVILDILDERLVEAISDVPELGELIDAIDKARPIMESHGLLQSEVEARKQRVRRERRQMV